MLMYTLGVVVRDELEWKIEEHEDGEIRVTCEEICAARLRLGTGALLGPIEPEPEWAEPEARMALLREDVVAILGAEAKAGRGPWAYMGADA